MVARYTKHDYGHVFTANPTPFTQPPTAEPADFQLEEPKLVIPELGPTPGAINFKEMGGAAAINKYNELRNTEEVRQFADAASEVRAHEWLEWLDQSPR